ncbi:TVP38/TMEM64 family protein [Bacillus shivajii]|uniref:TVP38/TMEM64 family protein n=1 Tax=Bacillus shivajii TaxID=1983719 RepID=UPI001CFC4461|nr:TVP38/TMEM64 family protein [Bacillus shivajii]UCZ55117.1 TVP38/TMEM64 family protein [Bacillus shivajii]
MPTKLLIKIGLFSLIILFLFWLNHSFLNLHPEQIQKTVLSFGIWAPLIFILMFAIRPFVLFPASILAIAGGLSFGPLIGPIVTYIGSLSGAALSFMFVRKLGHSFTQKEWQGKGKHLQKRIEENGFFYVLALRIIPVINFDFVSYLSGLSRIEFRKYIGATMLGIIPGTLAFNFLGATFVEMNFTMVFITSLLFVIAFSVPIIIRKRLEKKNIRVDLLPDEEL